MERVNLVVRITWVYQALSTGPTHAFHWNTIMSAAFVANQRASGRNSEGWQLTLLVAA